MRQAYVSGRYTGEVKKNVRQALACACELADKGWLPIVPHTAGNHGDTWDDAMARDLAIIRHLDPANDIVVMVPGWMESRGACSERQFALALGVPVVELRDVRRA